VNELIAETGSVAPGLRLAVKDLIDVEGLPTTAGSASVAASARPASQDAACLAGARRRQAEGGLRLVGKANLHELAFGATGINPWYGTPTNPLDPRLVPGGSSSGSAAVVGAGLADVALGTDTGGSVRIPSACCGTAGLKTTHGRIPLDGVFPLAPSLDTVGPMARDVAGLVEGMRLLEPGFEPSGSPPAVVGRLRRLAQVDPAVEAAVDAALSRAELDVVDVELDGWQDAYAQGGVVILAEAWRSLGHLLEASPGLIGEGTAERIRSGRSVTAGQLGLARQRAASWRAELERLLAEVGVLALPTLAGFPPPLDAAEELALTALTMPVNLAGLPALALPVPARPLPASLQLIGPPGSEEALLALGSVVEAASA